MVSRPSRRLRGEEGLLLRAARDRSSVCAGVHSHADDQFKLACDTSSSATNIKLRSRMHL